MREDEEPWRRLEACPWTSRPGVGRSNMVLPILVNHHHLIHGQVKLGRENSTDNREGSPAARWRPSLIHLRPHQGPPWHPSLRQGSRTASRHPHRPCHQLPQGLRQGSMQGHRHLGSILEPRALIVLPGVMVEPVAMTVPSMGEPETSLTENIWSSM